jgi:putative YhbY family RNA-binding protein
MPALTLNPAERAARRGEAHHLHPVVLVGAEGLSPAVLKEADIALKAHGLIKIRVFSEDRAARAAMLDELADRLDAAPVQHIGKLLVLWRPIPAGAPQHEHEQGADAQRMPGPRIVKIVKFSKSGTHRPQVKKVRVLGNQRVTPGGAIKRVKKRPVSVKKKLGG